MTPEPHRPVHAHRHPRQPRRPPGRRACLLAALVALGVLGAPASAQDAAAGRKVYRKLCEECHGRSGHGDGDKARSLGFRARDFSHSAFKCRSTPNGALPTDDDLLRTVTVGLPGSPMTAHDDLSIEDRRAVVAFVKTLAPRFSDESAPPPLALPRTPPAETAAAIDEGRELYRLLGCGKCHGPAGAADGPSAASLVDDWGDPIKVHNFVRTGKFKCGGEPADLYRTLHTGMNGSPMPSFTAGFAFAREDVGDLRAVAAIYGDEATAAARTYLESQPDRAALAALSPDQRAALIERRTWALVAYLRSLAER